MKVIGNYYIQSVDIECDCGYEETLQIEDITNIGNSNEDSNYNSEFVCPDCEKRIELDLFIDDCISEELDYDEEDEDEEYEE